MFTIDVPRARQVAADLLAAYGEQGIFGRKDMPEDLLPEGVRPGSEEHRRFVTLTVAIDYMRNADELWTAGRRTYADPQTRCLYDPHVVADTGLAKVIADMQRYGLSRKPQQDATTWATVCTTLATRFGGRVGVLLETAGTDAPKLLELVRKRYGGGFPFLKGAKIGPLWVRMLHDNCGVPLQRLGDIALPVDVHTAQATLQLGCVRPLRDRGPMSALTEAVQRVWREALKDSPEGVYPLKLDEPLWTLSRLGCRATQTWPCGTRGQCPVAAYCLPERVWLQVAGNPGSSRSEWRVTTDR
ncbi:MAG: hypothetical protein ACOYEW_00455 [Anaerolineae bacterium]